MTRKYHNHKLQTTPRHQEEEPLNHHKTPGRQIKQRSFMIRAGIMSGPDALLGLIFLSSFRNSLQISLPADPYVCHRWIWLTFRLRNVLPSSGVNVDSYCLLSMFDLDSGSACIFPFSWRSATPLLSFHRAFI